MVSYVHVLELFWNVIKISDQKYTFKIHTVWQTENKNAAENNL